MFHSVISRWPTAYYAEDEHETALATIDATSWGMYAYYEFFLERTSTISFVPERAAAALNEIFERDGATIPSLAFGSFW